MHSKLSNMFKIYKFIMVSLKTTHWLLEMKGKQLIILKPDKYQEYN